MKIKEFHQFFLAHENLSDEVLAEKLIIKFKLPYNKAVIQDLIKTTRAQTVGVEL